MTCSGGVPAKAAEKAKLIIYKMLSEPPGSPDSFGQITKYGEDRIPGCIKYDLPGAHRLITLHQDKHVVVLFVGNHDECDKWLFKNRGLRIAINKDTRKLSLVHVEIERKTPLGFERVKADGKKRVFDLLNSSEKQFLRTKCGDISRAEKVTVSSGDDEIIAAAECVSLPEGKNLLLDVLADLCYHGIEDAKARISIAKGEAILAEDSPQAFRAAATESVNQDSIVNLRDLSSEELHALLNSQTFQDWMLYLHPDQRVVVFGDYDGAVVLRGVSGSGKTSVILHRAKHLAEKYLDSRIAIITLSPVLAGLIKRLLHAICPETISARVDVYGIEDIARWVVNRTESPDSVSTKVSIEPQENRHSDLFTKIYHDEKEGDLQPIVDSLKLKDLSAESYLHQEFTYVRSGFRQILESNKTSGLPPRDEYLDPTLAPRKGREIPFSRDWRTRILSVLQRYETELNRYGIQDAAGWAHEAHAQIDNLSKWSGSNRYRAVLIDEVQDFSSIELEWLARLVSQNENSIFLCGDLRQQVFPKQTDIRKAGIKIKTRFDFKKNYRNPRKILEAGVALLHKFDPGKSGSDEIISSLDPEFSAREGAKPRIISANSLKTETKHVAEYLKLIHNSEGHPPACVIPVNSTSPEAIAKLKEEFRANGVEVTLISDSPIPVSGGLYICDLEHVKGFEFGTVILMRCSSEHLPRPDLPEEEAWRDARRLYVAMTRARDELLITYSGQPSRFLSGIKDQLNLTTVQAEGLVSDPELSSDLKAEIDRLRAENAALKKPPGKGALTMRVSEKGALSVYGLGRFPVTLYKDQWEMVLDIQKDIEKFIEDNTDKLKIR